MKHKIDPSLLTKQVEILLVGAGGTGSRMLEKLMCLHKAMKAKGHPHGLKVLVLDPDRFRRRISVGRPSIRVMSAHTRRRYWLTG